MVKETINIDDYSTEDKIAMLSLYNDMFADALATLTVTGMFTAAIEVAGDQPEMDFFEQNADITMLAACLSNELLMLVMTLDKTETDKKEYVFGNTEICFYLMQDILEDLYPGYKKHCMKVRKDGKLTMENSMFMTPIVNVMNIFCDTRDLKLDGKKLYAVREIFLGISVQAWKNTMIDQGEDEKEAEEKAKRGYQKMLQEVKKADNAIYSKKN